MRLSGALVCATPQQAAVVARHLPAHMALSRQEPGCLSFDVWQTDDPLVWRVEEAFTTRDAFAAHQRRARASAWGAATVAIARHYAITEG